MIRAASLDHASDGLPLVKSTTMATQDVRAAIAHLNYHGRVVCTIGDDKAK
jgi:hypothetical protein